MTDRKYRWNRNAASHREAITEFSKNAGWVALFPGLVLFVAAWVSGQDTALVAVLPVVVYLAIYFIVLYSKLGWYGRLNEASYKANPLSQPPPPHLRPPVPIYDNGRVTDWIEDE